MQTRLLLDENESLVHIHDLFTVLVFMKHRYMGGYMSGNILISNGLAAATLWYGGHLILEDRISGDTLIPFVLYQVYSIFGLSGNFT